MSKSRVTDALTHSPISIFLRRDRLHAWAREEQPHAEQAVNSDAFKGEWQNSVGPTAFARTILVRHHYQH